MSNTITRFTPRQLFKIRTATRQIFREGVAQRGQKNRYKKQFNDRPDWGLFFKPQYPDALEVHNSDFGGERDQSVAYMTNKKFQRMLVDATQYISDYQTPKR